jgi:hypothetical protein
MGLPGAVNPCRLGSLRIDGTCDARYLGRAAQICPVRPLRDFFRGLVITKGGIMYRSTPPFVDADLPEVLARVIYRWCELQHRRYPSTIRYASQAINRLPDLIRYSSVTFMPLAATSAIAYCHGGGRLFRWKQDVLTASRCGFDVRRCLFPQYKATRPYPRVTNRGV